jgi:hypothetical protein
MSKFPTKKAAEEKFLKVLVLMKTGSAARNKHRYKPMGS